MENQMEKGPKLETWVIWVEGWLPMLLGLGSRV